MKLVEFSVTDFQSFGPRQTLRLDDHITFLAGRNDVGKSALLRALAGPVEAPEGIGEKFAVDYLWRIPTVVIRKAIMSELDHPAVVSVFEGFPESTTMSATFSFAHRQGDQARVGHLSSIDFPEISLGRIERRPGVKGGWTGGPFAQTANGVEAVTKVVNGTMSAVRYMGPRRVDATRRSFHPGRPLDPDARNLADVLVDLVNGQPDVADELWDFVRAAFPQINRVTVPPQQDGSGYIGEPTIYYGPSRDRARTVPLRLCGTGVENVLALGVAILTAPSEQLILVDEPQAYLHPHAERVLFEFFAAHDEHQYVVATHSHTMLSEASLVRTRLVSMPGGHSIVTEVGRLEDVVQELEITPADLWLADRIVWVEGPSDVPLVERLLRERLPPTQRTTTLVRALPDASRFSSKSEKTASSNYQVLAGIAEAVAPLSTEMVFLFDSDEKTDEHMEKVQRSSGGRARFLSVRESENMFLHAAILQPVIARRAALVERDAPPLDEVAAGLERLVADLGDDALYPKPKPHEASVARVKGSAVLNRLFEHFTDSGYDKVADIGWFVDAALERRPSALQPLADALELELPAAE